MDNTSFQPGGQEQNQNPIPEIPKTQNLSDRLMPYRWHIVIVGGIIIALLFGAYSYAKYVAQQKNAEVVKQVEDVQKKIDEIRLKRLNSPSTGSGQSVVPTDWKTYTNTQYGYSISYPPSYSIKTTDYCGNAGCDLVQPTSSSYAVYIERPGGNEVMRDYVLVSLAKKGEEYFYINSGEQSLDFMGYKAKLKSTEGELMTKSLVVNRGDYIFHVSADYNLTNSGVSFDILSTFKFTTVSGATATPDPK